jgi:hypothetical protein
MVYYTLVVLRVVLQSDNQHSFKCMEEFGVVNP